jgi:RNA polymerase sigma-70 factor (ECF subfamily)
MGIGAGEDRSDGEEERALRGFQAGEDWGFEWIARRHQHRVYRLALALLGRSEDARDAAQEVFLRAFRALPGWRFEARLSTWLFRVTLNVCREARRARWREWLTRGRWRLLAASAPRASPAPDAGGEGRLLRLVRELPERQREVVVLRVFEELSVREAADALGVPEGTVKSNFFKAVGSLRKRLRHDPGRRKERQP